jgi:flagellar biosynthesis component FlhA
LRVITLDQPLARVFEGAEVESPELPLVMDPDVLERCSATLDSLLAPVRQRGMLPVSILCGREVRHKVVSFLRSANVDLGVVTFDELDPTVGVEPVAVWGAGAVDGR